MGQDEIDIMHIAQTCLLVLTPGMGDDIQAMKAGVAAQGALGDCAGIETGYWIGSFPGNGSNESLIRTNRFAVSQFSANES